MGMHVAQPPQTVDRVRGCQSSSDPPGPPHSPMTQVHPPRSSWPARRQQAAARSPRPHCAAASVGGVRATHPQRRNNSSAGRPPPSPTPAWSTTGHARAGCAGRRGRQSARDKTRAPPWSGALATRRSPPLLLSCCTTRRSQRRRRGESSCSTSAAARRRHRGAWPPPQRRHARGSSSSVSPSPPPCAISPQKRRRVGAPRRANRPPRVVSPSPGVRRRPPAPPIHEGCRHAGRGLCRFRHKEGGAGRGVATRPRALDGSSNEGVWVSQGMTHGGHPHRRGVIRVCHPSPFPAALAGPCAWQVPCAVRRRHAQQRRFDSDMQRPRFVSDVRQSRFRDNHACASRPKGGAWGRQLPTTGEAGVRWRREHVPAGRQGAWLPPSCASAPPPQVPHPPLHHRWGERGGRMSQHEPSGGGG